MTRFPAFCFKKLFATVLALYFVFSLSPLKAEEAPNPATETSEANHAPYPKPIPPFPPDLSFPQNEPDQWTAADRDFEKEKLNILDQASQLLQALFKRHLLKDTPDFYEKLSEATLQAILLNMDPEKLFFTQQHIFALRREFGTSWLQDMVENKDFGMLWALYAIREQVSLHYFKLLSENPFSLEPPQNKDLFPTHETDFAKDPIEQQNRWSHRAQLLNILFKSSYPWASNEDLKNLMSQFYQNRLSGLETTFLTSPEFPTDKLRQVFLEYKINMLTKSLFNVFSRFTLFLPTVLPPPDYLTLEYQDAWVQFYVREGLFLIVASQVELQEKAGLRDGDIVLAIKHADTPESDSTLEPLLFAHQPLQTLIAATQGQAPPDVRAPYKLPKKNLIFTLLRQKSGGVYELIEKVVFTKTKDQEFNVAIQLLGKKRNIPTVSPEEDELIHQNPLFSAKLYPTTQHSPTSEKVAVLELPDFATTAFDVDRTKTVDFTSWDYFPPVFLYQYVKQNFTTMRHLRSFFEQTYKLMAADDVSSFVLDLRANYGGDGSLAFLIMHAFRDTGKQDLRTFHDTFYYPHIAYEFSDPAPQWIHNYHHQATFRRLELLRPIRQEASRELGSSRINNIPLVILVGENTASAAEALAAELQAHGRALVVGSPTKGKGTVYHYRSFPNHSTKNLRIRLTFQKFFTSAGTSPHEVGVPLDIVIPTKPTERAFIRTLQPPQAFTDQELSSQSTLPQPQNDLLTIKAALRDPELIQSLQNAFDNFLQEDKYFSQLHSLWEQKKASRVGGELSLKAADYELHSYEKEHPTQLVTPRLPEDASWHLSGDVVLDQALWIAQKYAELLNSQESP